MVRRFHHAGIEVILDVVYNHTAEGSELGPTLSFRGVDNASYYRLQPDEPRYYINDTGCGNTLNTTHPRVVQLIIDSLRYWVEAMHVDGFRFDLATILGRETYGYDPHGGFFDALRQDPVLRRVKLIAEPWDVGPGGYQLGNFPPGFAEWNDRFRDGVRRFWRGDESTLPDLARSLLGSADLFERGGRRPYASVNFVTAHDGFTLTDLWSYNHKHNAANEEGNRDGHDDNRSWNCGVEGPTDDPDILDLRDRLRRATMATLVLSQGTQMILMGDEVGRTQGGDNNAYCQDNPIAWMTWDGLSERDGAFHEFVRGLIALRKRYPLLRERNFLHGRAIDGNGSRDVVWFRPDGTEMDGGAWGDGNAKVIGLLLRNAHQRLFVLANAYHDTLSFTLPTDEATEWRLRADSGRGLIDPAGNAIKGGAMVDLEGRSLLLYSGEEP
jgi:glycogen operon protein